MKILLTSLAISLTSGLLAQSSVGKFSMEFASSEFNIDATEPKDGEYKLYVDMFSLDRSVKTGGITLKSKDIPTLIAMLEEVKSKYSEWKALAIENNVTELNKEIPITNKLKCGGFFQYGGWKFDYSVTLKPRFLITPESTLALIHTGKMVASDNQYMDASDFVFAFKSVEEIDELIKVLQPQIVFDFYSSKNSTETIFN